MNKPQVPNFKPQIPRGLSQRRSWFLKLGAWGLGLVTWGLGFNSSYSQPVCLDRTIARIGNEVILLSDVESQRLQYQQMGMGYSISKCEVLEDLILQKLLLHQSALDSVEVNESQIESELDRRIRYFINQIGSEEKLEKYYNKSIIEIKAEFRDQVKEQLLVQTIQQKLTGDLKITPSEVRTFFNDIPPDSLPLINSEVEVAQIVKIPSISSAEKERVKNRLIEFQARIRNGEDFGTIAYLYSEDKESAKQNGEIGFVERGSLVPEFEAIAYNLKESEVSDIVETKFGFHIIQLIERRGERINVRHILIKPRTDGEALDKAKSVLDTIRQKITDGTIRFTDAAIKYSDDQETAKNGGLMINPYTGTSRFETSQADPTLFFTVDNLKVGGVSDPVPFQTKENRDAFRIVLLKSRTDPHQANLKDDYQKLQDLALANKQHETLKSWIKKKKNSTYIKIDGEFEECEFVQKVLK